MNSTENFIRKAVDTIGGVTVTSNQLGVSNNCIYGWITRNRVPNIFYARKIAELACMPIEFIRPV